MNFDDHPSPAAPFSGDGTGDIFDPPDPDLVMQSQTTSERVVDTQSGFLLVIKRLEDKLALSVRRRIGTPPSSSVVLTPDESVKLSRILSVSPQTERRDRQLKPPGKVVVSSLGELTSESKGLNHRNITRLLVGIACCALLFGGVIGFVIKHQTQAQTMVAYPLSKTSVDTFVRRYVGNMLDFNPQTYRLSQIKAMSAMAPELVDTYWTDTGFPLNARQLKQAPQGSTVMITQLNQEKLGANSTQVDIFAQMTTPDSKVSTPVHLKLKLGLDLDGQITVLEQKDLSNSENN